MSMLEKEEQEQKVCLLIIYYQQLVKILQIGAYILTGANSGVGGIVRGGSATHQNY